MFRSYKRFFCTIAIVTVLITFIIVFTNMKPENGNNNNYHGGSSDNSSGSSEDGDTSSQVTPPDVSFEEALSCLEGFSVPKTEKETIEAEIKSLTNLVIELPEGDYSTEVRQERDKMYYIKVINYTVNFEEYTLGLKNYLVENGWINQEITGMADGFYWIVYETSNVKYNFSTSNDRGLWLSFFLQEN